jgi:hypothetical protein
LQEQLQKLLLALQHQLLMLALLPLLGLLGL